MDSQLDRMEATLTAVHEWQLVHDTEHKEYAKHMDLVSKTLWGNGGPGLKAEMQSVKQKCEAVCANLQADMKMNAEIKHGIEEAHVEREAVHTAHLIEQDEDRANSEQNKTPGTFERLGIQIAGTVIAALVLAFVYWLLFLYRAFPTKP